MKYKRLLNKQFCALKYNIVLQGFIFSSNGFLVCYSITILFIIKVLCIAMFKPFKAIVCRVVWCVVIIARLLGVVVSVVVSKVINKVWIILLVWMVLWMECG